MDGRDLKSAFDQLEHYRIDFGFQQHEVAHYHGSPVSRLECDPATKRQSWFDGDTVQRHCKIAAREAIAVHVT